MPGVPKPQLNQTYTVRSNAGALVLMVKWSEVRCECLCVCTYIYRHICVCVYIHTYIYIYICIHTHTRTYCDPEVPTETTRSGLIAA